MQSTVGTSIAATLYRIISLLRRNEKNKRYPTKRNHSLKAARLLDFTSGSRSHWCLVRRLYLQ